MTATDKASAGAEKDFASDVELDAPKAGSDGNRSYGLSARSLIAPDSPGFSWATVCQAAAFVAVWGVIGVGLQLSGLTLGNAGFAYLLIGIPLVVLFQTSVRRKPLVTLWQRNAERYRLDLVGAPRRGRPGRPAGPFTAPGTRLEVIVDRRGVFSRCRRRSLWGRILYAFDQPARLAKRVSCFSGGHRHRRGNHAPPCDSWWWQVGAVRLEATRVRRGAIPNVVARVFCDGRGRVSRNARCPRAPCLTPPPTIDA